MKRKLVAIILVVLTAACFFLFGCETVKPDSSGGSTADKTFTVEETASGYSVKGLKDKSVTEIVVPSEINGKPVTEIAESAFKDFNKVISVVIPDTVTKIGKNVFKGMGALKSLTTPFVGSSASAKGEKALLGYMFGSGEFTGSGAVEQVYGENAEDREIYYIPSSLSFVKITGEKIGRGAFYGCGSITEAELGEMLTEIGEDAFFGNNIVCVYVNGNAVSSMLLGRDSCGGILSNVPAVYIKSGVTKISGFVKRLETKEDYVYNNEKYTLYANNKKYVFEAEQSKYAKVAPEQADYGTNGVKTSGGYYLSGWYPDGATGEATMEFNIRSNKDTEATFIFCCGPRDQDKTFNGCWDFTVNGETKKTENDVYLSLDKDLNFGTHYADWKEFEIMTIKLKKGENVIKMRFLPGGKDQTDGPYNNDMRVDYIALRTNAVLTWNN